MQVGCDKGNSISALWVLLNQIILEINDDKSNELLLQYRIKSNANKILVMCIGYNILASTVLEGFCTQGIIHPKVCH